MTKFFFLFFLLMLFCGFGKAQSARDKANNGQMKRMVFKQWDDWQPTPKTGFLGIPKNFKGWLFWDVLNHSYYKGPDRRPWRASPKAPFVQNMASISLQLGVEKKMLDSVKSMALTDLATEASMSGGALDLPYQLYFKQKFDGMFADVDKYILVLKNASPKYYNDFMTSYWGKEYLNDIAIFKDRIATIHSVFDDRGARMVSYLNIINQLEPVINKIKALVLVYVQSLLIPEAATKVKYTGADSTVIKNTDKEIVNQLLINWHP